MTKVVIWSADVGPIHGQGIITEYVSNWILPKIGTLSIYKYKAGFGLTAFFSWLYSVLGAWMYCLFNKKVVVYVVCSRSTFGFIRDVPILLLSRLGVKLIVHSHGGDIYDLLKQRWYSGIAMFVYQKSFLIVSNKPLENQCLTAIPNVQTIENYISSDSGRNRANLNKVPLVVGWNSNVMASKGFFDCAEAIRLVNDIGHKVTFKSIGRLVDDEIMGMHELNINLSKYKKFPWFEYYGPVSQRASIDFINECHAIALISKSEAQPFAIIEAMCSGAYVIISDIPALTFTVGNYPASIVQLDQIEELTRSIVDLNILLNNKRETLQKKLDIGAESARNRFSKDRFSKDMIDVFKKVLES